MSPLERQLKAAEARLAEVRTIGGERNEFVGGWGGGHLHTSSFAQTETMERERRELAAEVSRLKGAVVEEKRAIKKVARAAGDVANWTSRLLEGDTHFASGEDGLDARLVARTCGLVSREDWRAEREKLEAEEAEAAERDKAAEAAAEAERRVHKAKQKRKRQRAEQSRLSFADDGEGEGEGADGGDDGAGRAAADKGSGVEQRDAKGKRHSGVGDDGGAAAPVHE
jgi:hypothetical protein